MFLNLLNICHFLCSLLKRVKAKLKLIEALLAKRERSKWRTAAESHLLTNTAAAIILVWVLCHSWSSENVLHLITLYCECFNEFIHKPLKQSVSAITSRSICYDHDSQILMCSFIDNLHLVNGISSVPVVSVYPSSFRVHSWEMIIWWFYTNRWIKRVVVLVFFC